MSRLVARSLRRSLTLIEIAWYLVRHASVERDKEFQAKSFESNGAQGRI